MSRLIKFRAYDPKEGNIYMEVGTTGGDLIVPGSQKQKDPMDVEEREYYNLGDASEFIIDQFSEHYDSEGKEIYENDLVRHTENGEEYLVVSQRGCFFLVPHIPSSSINLAVPMYTLDLKNYTLAGNIHLEDLEDNVDFDDF